MEDFKNNDLEKTQVRINKSEVINDSLLSDIFPRFESNGGGIPHVFTKTSVNSKRKRFKDKKSQIKNNDTIYHQDTSSTQKKKRKRRLLSCNTCRKLKTKCVYEGLSLTCERCKRLRIECNSPHNLNNYYSKNDDEISNLHSEEIVNEPITISKKVKTSDANELDTKGIKPGISQAKEDSQQIKQKIDKIEDNLYDLSQKINQLIQLQEKNIYKQNQFQEKQLQTQNELKKELEFQKFNFNNRELSHDSTFINNTEASTPSIANFVDLSAKIPIREDLSAPLNLINKIKTVLINREKDVGKESNFEEKKSDFMKGNEKFIEFYLKNEVICLQLAKEFLENSHYYIIPGGISIIDRDYVLEHPFITCIFVLIAMMLSRKYEKTEIQNELKEILNNIIYSIQNKDLLSDHDIESILYACIYDIGEFDKWILSTSGLMHYFLSVDTRSIIERVVNENVFLDDDLFHLRILNALCSCHLQTAIGMGRSIMINDNWWKVYTLTVIFPNATVGDAIQVAQLDLFKILVKDLKDKEYFQKYQFLESMEQKQKLFTPCNLIEWRQKWDKIISKDVSLVTYYSYYFSYIILSRKFIEVFSKTLSNDQMNIAFNTASHYSFELLKTFLDSEFKFIKGIPSFQLNQVLYACITLFEYLVFMNIEDRKKTLNIITKTYWNLNKTGQELNEVTNTIAQIIRKLVELANKNQVLNIEMKPDKEFIGSGSITKISMYRNRKNSQQQQKLSAGDLPMFLSTNSNGNNESAIVDNNEGIIGYENMRSTKSSPLILNNMTAKSTETNMSPPLISKRSGSELNIHSERNSERNSDTKFKAITTEWPKLNLSEIRTNIGKTIADNGDIRSTLNPYSNYDYPSPSPMFTDMILDINNVHSNHHVNKTSANGDHGQINGFEMPDLSTFNNFDEFFKDLFSDIANL